jgi:hypothetical protein
VAAPRSQLIACSPARNGRRAWPLNSVVMRHCRSIAVAAILAIASGRAAACSCVKWDPSYFLAEYAEVFLGEVTGRGEPEPIIWHSEPMNSVPITVKVLEALKGGATGDRRLFQVARPSSCSLDLPIGARRIFLIWKPGNTVIGGCSTYSDATLNQFKSAMKAVQ